MSNRTLSLGTRMQGTDPFLELQGVNPDHFTFSGNSTLSLADNIELTGDLTMGGDLIIEGGLQLGTGSNLTAGNLTATTKLTTPIIQFADNLAAGLTIETADGADYLVLKSSDGSEQIQLKKTTFTDGNSVILGTNGSRGILQYGNVKNSTIDTTNTVSANTSGSSASCTGNSSTATLAAQSTLLQNARTIGGVSFNGGANINLPGVNSAGNQSTSGTASAWTVARTTSFLEENNNTIGSVSLSGSGATTSVLKTLWHDQTNSSAHKVYIKNAISGHTSTSLEQQLIFENEHMSGMSQSENLIQKWVVKLLSTSMLIYDITASNTFQSTDFLYDSTGDCPRINNLSFNKDSSTGTFISLHRSPSSGNDTSTAERQLPNGLRFYSSGEYAGSNLGGLQGGIESYYISEEVGETKIYSKYVAGSVQEASFTIRKDIMKMVNASSLEFGNSDRRITYNSSECAFSGSTNDIFTFDNKMRVGQGADANNPSVFGIESGNIASGGADVELLSMKFSGNGTSHLYNFVAEDDGQLSFAKTTYATNQDGYSGTKTIDKRLMFKDDRTSINILGPTACGLHVSGNTSSQPTLTLGNSSNASNYWIHNITADYDYIINSVNGRNYQVQATGTLTHSTEGAITLVSNDDKILIDADDDMELACGGDFHFTKGTSGKLTIGTGPNDSVNYNEAIYVYRPTYNSTDNAVANRGMASWMVGESYAGYGADSWHVRTYHGGQAYSVPTGEGIGICSGTFNDATRKGGLHVSTYKQDGADGNTGSGKYYIRYSGGNSVFGTSNAWNGTLDGKVGIYSPHVIWAEHYVIASDRRIKCEIEELNDMEALDVVLKLETVKYNYKDPIKRRKNKTIGYIAQSVREHIPEATAIRTEFIPNDELIECDDWEGNILTVNVNWEDNNTGILKFVVANNDDEKEEEIDLKCVMEDGNKTNKFKFEKKYDECVWIKTEVDDFITINKDMIFATHHSAIQQLHKNSLAQEERHKLEIDGLRKVIEDLAKTVKLNESALKNLI